MGAFLIFDLKFLKFNSDLMGASLCSAADVDQRPMWNFQGNETRRGKKAGVQSQKYKLWSRNLIVNGLQHLSPTRSLPMRKKMRGLGFYELTSFQQIFLLMNRSFSVFGFQKMGFYPVFFKTQ